MNDSSEVKRFFEYLPEIVKFHKLKNEGLARLIFVLVLFCQFIGSYVQYKFVMFTSYQSDLSSLYATLIAGKALSSEAAQSAQKMLLFMLGILGVSLLVKLVSNLFCSVYMYSYISELRQRDSGVKASFAGAFKHMGRLIGYNLVFGLLVMIGSMFFLIPGILAYIVFVFGYCYVIDLKLTVPEAMTASNDISRGKKLQLIYLFAGYYLLFKLPILLLLSGSTLGSAFVVSFFTTISSLILQRFITQLYMDLEYKKSKS